jgi:hypothetical protein
MLEILGENSTRSGSRKRFSKLNKISMMESGCSKKAVLEAIQLAVGMRWEFSALA